MELLQSFVIVVIVDGWESDDQSLGVIFLTAIRQTIPSQASTDIHNKGSSDEMVSPSDGAVMPERLDFRKAV